MNSTLKAKIILEGNLPNPLWYELTGLNQKVQIHGLVKVPLKSGTKTGLVLEIEKKELPFKVKPVTNVINDGRALPADWVNLLLWLSRYYSTPLSRTFSLALPKTAVNLLEKSGFSPPENPEVIAAEPRQINTPVPNQDQSDILEEIGESLKKKEPEFNSYLLHGITGSGKTLIYIYLARICLSRGKNVLILIPEIALTAQIVERFKSELQQKVHVYHSNLSASEKRDVWQNILSGSARIIIGVRSLVLFPTVNIGLIIVDEEHDSSYKQSDSSPRYNARDLALYRGKQVSCPVVLGSATPSIESFYNAQNGKHKLLQLKNRATDSKLPDIHIVDMKKQSLLQGNEPLSTVLRDALTRALAGGEQVILLLNRRGFAKKQICKKCGNLKICPQCDTALIPHRQNSRLMCHCCHYFEKLDSPCRHCQGREFIQSGIAIERVEENLKIIFPDVNCLRLDRDSTAKVGMAKKIIQKFRKGEAQILLGTQMVAKGYDFPAVNLVGIIDGDTGLGIPDFRAHERIFQLITQVSGRAGRHSKKGQVFLQTFNPENPALKLALKHDFTPFYRAELAFRKELFYPPYCRLFKVEFTGKNDTRVAECIKTFANIMVKKAEILNIKVVGPAKSLFARRKGHFRWQLIGKGRGSNQLQTLISESFTEYNLVKRPVMNVIVDMDPTHLV